MHGACCLLVKFQASDQGCRVNGMGLNEMTSYPVDSPVQSAKSSCALTLLAITYILVLMMVMLKETPRWLISQALTCTQNFTLAKNFRFEINLQNFKFIPFTNL